MEFTASRSDLVRTVANVEGVVERNPARFLLLNIRLHTEENRIEVSGTDTKVSIHDVCVGMTVVPGSITVQAKTLLDILRAFPEGVVNFAVDERNWVTITCGPSRYHLPGLPDEDYPDVPSFPEAEESRVFPGASFEKLFSKTDFAISDDESRPVLCGCYLEVKGSTLGCVATDGHRLSWLKLPLEEEQPEFTAIVPRKVVKELKRLLGGYSGDLKVFQDDSHQYYKVGTCSVTARKIEGAYPNFRQVIPQEFTREVHLNKPLMEALLRRVLLVLGDRPQGMNFEVSPGKLRGEAESPEMGEAKDEFVVGYEGETFQVSYNPRYIQDVLRVVESEEVLLKLNDPMGPGVLVPTEGDDLLCIVMPMKIK